MKATKINDLPLIYACSGSSTTAQITHKIALELDWEGKAEMSCIAGVGGGVKSKMRTALSGRKIIALDGCALNCAKKCLSKIGVKPTHHFTLTDLGMRKRYHEPCSPMDYENARKAIEQVCGL